MIEEKATEDLHYSTDNHLGYNSEFRRSESLHEHVINRGENAQGRHTQLQLTALVGSYGISKGERNTFVMHESENVQHLRARCENALAHGLA